jgi:hypothetical protein
MYTILVCDIFDDVSGLAVCVGLVCSVLHMPMSLFVNCKGCIVAWSVLRKGVLKLLESSGNLISFVMYIILKLEYLYLCALFACTK